MPLSVMLLPIVTPSSVPLLLASVVPVTVPPMMVPLKLISPPVPNWVSKFRLLAVLVKTPVKLTALVELLMLPIPAVLKVPPKPSVPPVKLNAPALLQAPVMFKVPPDTANVPPVKLALVMVATPVVCAMVLPVAEIVPP